MPRKPLTIEDFKFTQDNVKSVQINNRMKSIKLSIISVNFTNIDIIGGNTGQITIIPTGGRTPYTFSIDIDNATYNTVSSFTNLKNTLIMSGTALLYNDTYKK